MASPILQVKPEEIGTAEKRRKYTASITGCGQIGIIHAFLLAQAGFRVSCVDADQTIVNSILRGKTSFLEREVEFKLKNYAKTGLLNATTDFKTTVSQSNVIIIAVPPKIDEKGKINYSSLEKTCRLVGSSLGQGSLVIIAATVGIGVTQGLIKETLESTSGLKAGVNFGLVYSPLRISDGYPLETIVNQERIVAATDKNSLEGASLIIGCIMKGNVKEICDIRMAEASMIFEGIQQDVNSALVKEFAFFCEKAGLDYFGIYSLMKDTTSHALCSPTLADNSTRLEPYLFSEDTENLNLKLRMPATAREVNEEIGKHAVSLINDALRDCGKNLRRARISLLGISKLPNMKGRPKRMVEKTVKMLEARGAKIGLYDPFFSGDELSEMQRYVKKNLTETLERADCILILTGHEQFKRLSLKKLRVMMKMPAAIVDFEGVMEPGKVEKEGFIYRGLGRGVWKK
jgi:nucleotide sugar dehydrogenase